MTQLGEEFTRYVILLQVADQINSCHNGLLSTEHDGPTDVTNQHQTVHCIKHNLNDNVRTEMQVCKPLHPIASIYVYELTRKS